MFLGTCGGVHGCFSVKQIKAEEKINVAIRAHDGEKWSKWAENRQYLVDTSLGEGMHHVEHLKDEL